MDEHDTFEVVERAQKTTGERVMSEHSARTDALLALGPTQQLRIRATRREMSTIRGGIETQLVGRGLGAKCGLRSERDGDGFCRIWLDPTKQVPKSRLTRVPGAPRKASTVVATEKAPTSIEIGRVLRYLLASHTGRSRERLFE